MKLLIVLGKCRELSAAYLTERGIRGFLFKRKQFFGILISNTMKDFNKWNEKKKEIEADGIPDLYPKEREIWWCSLGVNF